MPDSVFAFGIPGDGQTIPVTVVDEALAQLEPTAMATRSHIPDPAPIADALSLPTLATAKKKLLS